MADRVMTQAIRGISEIIGNPCTQGDKKLLQQVFRRVLRNHPEFNAFSHTCANTDLQLRDFLLMSWPQVPTTTDVFDRLRWGGQVLFASRDRNQVIETAKKFTHDKGFEVEQECGMFHEPFLGLRLPFFSSRVYYFIARKTLLVRPGESTDRFTYHVELIRHPSFGPDYVVMKQVPTFERVVARLKEKFPDVDQETIEKRARKFTDKIFPVFLTREAGMLRILAKTLPEKYRTKVPREVGIEQDNNGFVRTLYMNWLRNGGKPISQLSFARQSAELLTALHECARVIHLDLRLDNFVITPDGVGFVDFGSAVRGDEQFAQNSLLGTLYEEMMRTSQIQKMLGKMQDRGMITSEEIRGAYGKIDKAVDFFYLAVQMNHPQANPDFKDLVVVNKESQEARSLMELTDKILKPADPDNPEFKSARDILNGIERIEMKLQKTQ